jgi:predicted RNase H-like nuclease (RuvC/YqgF family)
MMSRHRIVVGLAAVIVGVLTASGVATAADREPQRTPGDHRAACERLAEHAQALRARIGEIQAIQERIRAKLASGDLRPAQEARAKHALRKLEALQQELEARLARVLDVYAERCQR